MDELGLTVQTRGHDWSYPQAPDSRDFLSRLSISTLSKPNWEKLPSEPTLPLKLHQAHSFVTEYTKPILLKRTQPNHFQKWSQPEFIKTTQAQNYSIIELAQIRQHATWAAIVVSFSISSFFFSLFFLFFEKKPLHTKPSKQ